MPDAPPEIVERVESLRKEIRHHDDLYHNKDAPQISDYDYDVLKRELLELEEQFPALVVDSSPSKGSEEPRRRRSHRCATRCG